MALSVKTPRKKKTRAVHIPKNKKNLYDFTGWEEWDGATYHRKVHHYRQDIYENFKTSDIAPEVYSWMKENGYSKADIEAVKKQGPSSSLAISCKLLRAGMPDLNPKHADYWNSLPGTMGDLKPATAFVLKTLDECITKGRLIVEEKQEEEKEKSNKYIPSIQERITEQAQDACDDIEGWLEGFIVDKNNFDPKGFDFKKHFTKKGVTQAHARKMKSFYENELDDFKELERYPTAGQLAKMDEKQADLWAQLKEGYAHLKKADIAKYTTAIENLMQALDFIIDQSKATRKPRKPKPRSADKVVAKVKYLKVDEKYKLTSVNAVDIVGASELWVFNVKTRKLGKYVASNIDPKGMGRDGSGLSVKGASIVGYDENLSVQKTLRKPAEQLATFNKSGKIQLRKFMDGIRTTETKLNGRINADTMLLKVQ